MLRYVSYAILLEQSSWVTHIDKIYASVGSEEKASYLVKTFHIPRHRIFNSRDSSFLPGILRETDGRGVDVVLNSLAGELLHASWSCVAEFGKMIEIGKRDILEHGKLPMDAFGGNRAFFWCGSYKAGPETWSLYEVIKFLLS